MTKLPWKYFHELTVSFLAVPILALSLSSIGLAQSQTNEPQNNQQTENQNTEGQAQASTRGQPTKIERESWRKTVLRVPLPKKGCFAATYPETQWHEVTCKTPPRKLYPPKRPGMIRTETVGGAGPDFSAVVTGHITEAEGSFDSMSGVTSECTVACPGQVCPANPSCTASTGNQYSLQLNSRPFTTSTCSASPIPASCRGWEQFVYSSTGFGGFIQYWLENYGPAGTACPSPQGASCSPGFSESDGWCPFQFSPTGNVYCVVNAANSAPAPAQAITLLDQLKLTGAAAGVNGNTDDSITVTEGNTVFTANGGNYFPDLGSQWQEVEFNVFGDGNGDQAVFNSGAKVAVRTGVASGTSTGPACDLQSFTGESTNLTLVNTPPPSVSGTLPALLFSQNNPPPSGAAATCADATSVGDTHITTFDGLYYDFQASGDFILARDTDFIVEARQASGAPTWPNAAVNKAVATQMGTTRVAVYIEPTRLVIDGTATTLADGKSTLLPTGVQVTRQGNVYIISAENGDHVRLTLNSTWIDTVVGLGHTPRPDVLGLLGNPRGNAHELITSNQVVLRAPVAFADLYRTYAESWRVPPRESLFNQETNIKFGIPSKPFYASDLTRQQVARGREICKAAGVTNSTFLDSCILDTTVLNDKTAAKVFVHLPPPVYSIKPGVKGGDHGPDCDCDKDDRDHDHDRKHDRD